MSIPSDRAHPVVIMLSAFCAVIVGFLIAAQGYRYGSFWLIILGLIVIGVGLALFALKIKRRNEGA